MTDDGLTPRQRASRKYDRSHRSMANARQAKWPWRKAAAAVKQAKRSARVHGVAEGELTKEIFARLHLLPCTYCGVIPAMEVDHVAPFRLGGTNDVDNLVPACPSCNRSRGAYVMNAVLGRSTLPEFDTRSEP